MSAPPSPASSTSSLISLSAGLKSSHGPKPRMLRRLDLLCCSIITYFPLLIVYGATTWAVWVEAWSISLGYVGGFRGKLYAFVGFMLYVMLIWSYSVATFSKPGSPLDNKNHYSHLPTTETSVVTVKASGEERYCKKCQCRKPDRSHHCSTCKCCVLKMDHHCPWLANCLGLNNYKPFVLFTIYLSLFCLFACGVSSYLLYDTMFQNQKYLDTYIPINWVMLAVISFIVGLVLSGFSMWHIMLVLKAQTTIESLEKTRYNSPFRRRSIPPGATLLRSPMDHSQPLSPDYLANRERERYNAYLIEETSRELPNAFDLGKKRNFVQVFGEKWFLWGIPVMNSLGDGWTWETSESWKEAQRDVAERRNAQASVEQQRSTMAGWGNNYNNHINNNNNDVNYYNNNNNNNNNNHQNNYYNDGAPTTLAEPPRRTPSWPARKQLSRTASTGSNGSAASKASRILGAREEEFSHGLGGSRYSPKIAAASREFQSSVLMQDLRKKPMSRDELSEDDDYDDYETSSDEVDTDRRRKSKINDDDDNWADGW